MKKTKKESWEARMKKEAKKYPKNTPAENQTIDNFFKKAFQKMNLKKPA